MEQRIAYLLQKCSNNDLTATEEAELNAFFMDENNRDLFNRGAADLLVAMPADPEINNVVWEPLLVNVLQADKVFEKEVAIRKVSYWWQYAAAAVLTGVLVGLVYWWMNDPKPASMPLASQIGPGTDKAILQLSNGSRIVLTDIQNGVVGQQGAAQVVKLDSGFVAYQAGRTNSSEAVAFNTLTTPRGGQFKIMLPDGSLVWLNAASSLKYPAVFTGDKRVVELTGEAYFEVAANARQPFYVKSKEQEVMVLGTSFNINAYDDEPVATTTLLSGKVKVSGASFSGVMQPGEQVQRKGSDNWQLIKDVDTDNVMAWKKGLFSFNRADVTTVMRQLARWYDVTVIFETKNRQQQFIGEIPRNVSLDKALEILKFSDIHYIVTGRTIKIID
jgi:ferric-dicitrate binding protein FerR (iron transport regulator)